MEPGTTLMQRQLEALVMIDGCLSVAQIDKHLSWGSGEELGGVLQSLLNADLVQLVSTVEETSFDPGSFFDSLTVVNTSPEASERDHKAALTGARLLQKNGYCVNMAQQRPSKKMHAIPKRYSVLAIDDDADICNLLKLYLKLEGIDVRTACNRAEVIEQFRSNALPDLVLLDVVMPDVNGFDLLGRIRNRPELKALPIIMLTAESSRGGVLRGITGGADGYVTKPFQIQPLVYAIKAVLGLEYSPQEVVWDSL